MMLRVSQNIVLRNHLLLVLLFRLIQMVLVPVHGMVQHGHSAEPLRVFRKKFSVVAARFLLQFVRVFQMRLHMVVIFIWLLQVLHNSVKNLDLIMHHSNLGICSLALSVSGTVHHGMKMSQVEQLKIYSVVKILRPLQPQPVSPLLLGTLRVRHLPHSHQQRNIRARVCSRMAQ